MRGTSPGALFALLLPALAQAVSLSDMKPRAENLPSDCQKIYDSQISGCGIPDFTTNQCTDTCVRALQAMVGPIKSACGGQGVTGQNLIVAFLANVGPEQICPDAANGGWSSHAAPESTPSPSPTPSPRPRPTSTTEPKTSETSTSEPVQSTSLLVDTSSAASTRTRTRTPAFSGTTTATSLRQHESSTHATTTTARAGASSAEASDAAGATSTGASAESAQQEADDQSGGGSPFDDEGNMFSGADSLSSASVLVSLGIAVLVVAFLFR